MAGELRDVGMRPKLVASFKAPGAAERFRQWRDASADALAAVPLDALRVEYGRGGDEFYVRVRIDEEHIPPGLRGPDEVGAAAGLPPRPAAP